jgi:hypothetical protein
MMIFDNMNLERINIKINGTQHPTYEYQVNNEDLQRLYAAFLSCNYKKDLDEGTCVSYNSYLRYKTGSNVFMDELVNYRSSPIGRDL